MKVGDVVYRYKDSPVSYSFMLERYAVKKITPCGAWIENITQCSGLLLHAPELTWRKFTGSKRDFAQLTEYGAAKAYVVRKRYQIRMLEDKLLHASTRLREIQQYIRDTWITNGGSYVHTQ